jgi:hypothetical protein
VERRPTDASFAGFSPNSVTRLDRPARSTRDLLNILATITGKKAGFKSLGDTWADTTDTARALDADRAWRVGGVRARFDQRAPAKAGSGPWRGASKWASAEAHAAPAARSDQAPRSGRGNACRHRPQLEWDALNSVSPGLYWFPIMIYDGSSVVFAKDVILAWFGKIDTLNMRFIDQ